MNFQLWILRKRFCSCLINSVERARRIPMLAWIGKLLGKFTGALATSFVLLAIGALLIYGIFGYLSVRGWVTYNANDFDEISTIDKKELQAYNVFCEEEYLISNLQKAIYVEPRRLENNGADTFDLSFAPESFYKISIGERDFFSDQFDSFFAPVTVSIPGILNRLAIQAESISNDEIIQICTDNYFPELRYLYNASITFLEDGSGIENIATTNALHLQFSAQSAYKLQFSFQTNVTLRCQSERIALPEGEPIVVYSNDNSPLKLAIIEASYLSMHDFKSAESLLMSCRPFFRFKITNSTGNLKYSGASPQAIEYFPAHQDIEFDCFANADLVYETNKSDTSLVVSGKMDEVILSGNSLTPNFDSWLYDNYSVIAISVATSVLGGVLIAFRKKE